MRKKYISYGICLVMCLCMLSLIGVIESKHVDLRFWNQSQKEIQKDTLRKTNDESVGFVMGSGDLRISFLSAEIYYDVHDIDSDKYPVENFKAGKLPSKQGIYIFWKCYVKNLRSNAVYNSINIDAYIKNNIDPEMYMQDELLYYDKAQNLKGEERKTQFFWRTYEPDEQVECVIGMGITDYPRYQEYGKADETIYVGIQPAGLEEFTEDTLKGYIAPVDELLQEKKSDEE